MNSQCKTINHTPLCACNQGFTGDPTIGCTKIVQCIRDTDCPNGALCAFGICSAKCSNLRDCLSDQACVSGKCVPKCSGNRQCPQYSECRGGVCTSVDQCKSDLDCKLSESCHVSRETGRKECKETCTVPNICGKNAGCSALSHKAQCRCPGGK